jgi:hypothetical protein
MSSSCALLRLSPFSDTTTGSEPSRLLSETVTPPYTMRLAKPCPNILSYQSIEGSKMNCERCGDAMCEEQLVVQGGLVKVKNMTVWHCTNCGRTEYISISPHPGSCSMSRPKAQGTR